MNKKFSELEEIHYSYGILFIPDNTIHFSLPLNKSNFSFYKKFHAGNIQDSILFLTNYVQYLSTI